MATQTKHRLGDILISKGLITPIQLNIAMEEQKKRRQQLDPLDFAAQTSVAPLGEILIELGFIDRMQLKRGLGWQSVVRKVTFAMSLCAPLLSISYEAAAAPLVPIVSTTKTSNSLPLRIEAEDYTSMTGVQTETTTDAGGGLNVGYIDANDTMSYSSTNVTIPVTGSYKIVYRVASTLSGGSFTLSEGSKTYDTISVPNTGGYQKWVNVERIVTLTAGVHTFTIKALTGGFNINWFNIDSMGVPLPQTIQAEDYSAMTGIQAETTTDAGGGLNVGYIDANDSMSYESVAINIPTTGSYQISYRVASGTGGGKFSFNEADGTAGYDTVTVPGTGSWQTWTTITRTVTLPAGVHKFAIKSLTGGFNINWFKIENAGAALPQTIQAENYSAMTGVQTETTSDTGGGQNVGYIHANDNMSYENNMINIPTTGTYQISYRVASGASGGKFAFIEAGGNTAYDTVTVPGTGSWQTWTTITRTVTLPAGTHKFAINSLTGGFNINWFKIENAAPASSSISSVVSISSSKPITVTPSSSSAITAAVSSIPKIASSVAAVSSSSIKPIASVSSSSVANVASSSSAAASNTLPFTIKANSFSTMSGIQTETTADTGGGTNVGYIDANDWLDFANSSVNIPLTGTYKVSYRVASAMGGGSFILNEAGESKAFDTVAVENTGGWQNWTTIERTVTLTAGAHTFGITAINGGFNLNWLKIEQISTPLPITIEAEKFSAMSGIQTETTTDTGGGLNVGYLDANDWMAYSDVSIFVATPGSYTVTYRVASASGGGSFSLNEIGSTTPLNTITVPSTGGWQNWIDVKHNITLTAGTHTFRINALTSGFNLNWFKIDNANASTASSTGIASSSKAAVASSVSSQATTTVNASSKASFSSSTAGGGSTSVVDGVVVSKVAGPVSMNWVAPNARQNGTVLDITEIAGYEIRYKLSGDNNFTYISINDAWTNMYNFAWLEGNYVFQIAAFDKDGLYSEFVDVVSR